MAAVYAQQTLAPCVVLIQLCLLLTRVALEKANWLQDEACALIRHHREVLRPYNVRESKGVPHHRVIPNAHRAVLQQKHHYKLK